MRTYGVYVFAARDKEIRLKMEPQAATRFKRVFERAEKKSIDFVTIAANPENARELEWFMNRYPLQPRQERDAKLLDQLARKFDRMLAAVAEMTAPGYEPPSVDLALPARHYQLLPAAILEATGGVLVGDEAGLGKTVEAIVALVKPNALPALIVTLTALPKQFQREIARFAPGLSTYVLQRASAYTRNKYGFVPQDPEIASVLGIKRAQLEGIRDPKGGVLQGTVDRDAVKRLAATFLKSAGKAVPDPPKPSAPIVTTPATPPAEDTLFNFSEGAA